ncbi:MAG: hypothetical protein RLZZ618_383 [Pseudomonadota bacterium]|jgi:hypothetical protein
MALLSVWSRRVAGLAIVLALAACSPTLNWRQVRPEGSGLVALFPCKPTAETRQVTLEGTPVALSMQMCQAGGLTWAVASAELADPASVGPVLAALLAGQRSNLRASDPVARAFSVRGMTPRPESQRVGLSGSFPDGRPVRQEMALFSRGARIFQAMVMGERIDAAAADNFFNNLQLPS